MKTASDDPNDFELRLCTSPLLVNPPSITTDYLLWSGKPRWLMAASWPADQLEVAFASAMPSEPSANALALLIAAV
jgi:hypothetical protein